MNDRRTHFVTTTDGVSVGGAVRGQGPPLVLLQGIIADGDIDWQALLGRLTGRFVCHVPSWRGRGLSSGHPDLSFDRLVEDVLTYVDSIEHPARLTGWSGGAGLALAVAARSDDVTAVAPFEPVTPRMMDEHERTALGDAVARMRALAAQGRFADGLRAFADFLFDDEEIAVAEKVGYFKAAARYVPQLLDFLQQQAQHEGPTHEDPAVLGAISAPVLVLVGSDTKRFATAYARHVVDHVPNAQMRKIPGAGHAAPLTHPGALADALAEFLAPLQRPGGEAA